MIGYLSHTDARARFFRILLMLLGILVCGTAGYHWLEGWGIEDSLYMVVITLSTVGYGETHTLSPGGRIFTMVLIVAGVGLVTYAVGSLTRMIIEGEIRGAFWRRRAMTKIRRMQGHHIICGYGRIGSLVAREFAQHPLPFVVIEGDEAVASRIPEEIPVVVGDATEEDLLLQAGIERARGLVSVLRSDADNLFVTLTARGLNPDLFILSRYEEEKSKKKLLRAGADKVVSPHTIGGTRMAMAVLRPSVIDFVELATTTESLGLQLEEVEIRSDSPLAGRTLAESPIRSEFDVIVVAIQLVGGHMEFNPSAQSTPQVGDRLIVIGDREHLDRLDVLAGNLPA